MWPALPFAAPPPALPPPLTPIINILVLDSSGNPVRNDNLTNFAYVGPNDGVATPPEVYNAYRPGNPADPTPIQPGETTQLRNAQTGKYCRLAQLPAGYVSPTTCNTQGVICDQDNIATATILTYTGSGLSYNGVPLVQSLPSKTLVLSADPACTVPDGDKLTFPLAVLRECLLGCALLQLLAAHSGQHSAHFSCCCTALHCTGHD